MRKGDVRPPNEKSHAYHLALLTTDVIFAYGPLLQFLLSPNAYFKDSVCKFVVSFVTRHDILCPNAVKRDVGKTRCKSDVILRNYTLLRKLLRGIC